MGYASTYGNLNGPLYLEWLESVMHPLMVQIVKENGAIISDLIF